MRAQGFYRELAQSSVPLRFGISDSFDMDGDIDVSVDAFLGVAGYGESTAAVYYCVRELIANAEKAVLKRACFDDHHLRIDSEPDYDTGSAIFHDEYSSRTMALRARAAASGLKVFLELRIENDALTIDVINNCVLADQERERIGRSLRKAQELIAKEISFPAIDPSEGAGLGLVIIALTLKQVGVPLEAFSIGSRDGTTTARIQLPVSLSRRARMLQAVTRLVSFVDSLPNVPDKVSALLADLRQPDADLSKIAGRISTDPSLAAELLRLVNSAACRTAQRIGSIHDAVRIVGINGLRNMLFHLTVNMNLSISSRSIQELWNHSTRVAFYAWSLGAEREKNREFLSNVYLAGLIHDIGHIIQLKVTPEDIKIAEALSANREVPEYLLEEAMSGINHIELGQLLAEKWNFPEFLIAGIKYHHQPWSCGSADRGIAALVYVANCMDWVERGKMEFYQINNRILKEVGLDAQPEFEAARARYSELYRNK